MSVAASSPQLHDLFHLPLSAEAYDQFLDFSVVIQSLQLQPTPDIWSYVWGSSTFSSNKAYKFLIGHRQIHPVYRWLWKLACQNKRKIFFWLILKDRLSTRALLRRRNMQLPDYSCVLCHHNVEEDLAHLLFHCSFASACWSTLSVIIPSTPDPCAVVDSLKLQLGLPFFLEIIVTMCWSIWMMRNDAIFRGLPHSVRRCKQMFKTKFALVKLRAKARLRPSLDSWIAAFV